MIMSDSSYKTILSPQYLVDCDTLNNGCNSNINDLIAKKNYFHS